MRTTPKYEGYCILPNGGHSEGVFLLRGRQPLRFRRLVGLLRSRSYRARNPVEGLCLGHAPRPGVSKTKWPIGTEEKSSKYLGVTIGKRLEWKAHVVDIVSLSKPKHRQVQPLAASPYVDPAVVERAWEQKVPPCLLKGLAGLSMQSEALWRNLDTAVGEGARQVLGMHKFANGDL